MKLFPFLIFALLVACAPGAKQDVVNLEPKDVKDILDAKEKMGLFVLNVHTPYEGKLEKTDAIIEDWQNIAAHQDELPADKKRPILVYCRSGRMSSSAVEQLRELGYKNIYHLNGGMVAYEKAGFEIVDKT